MARWPATSRESRPACAASSRESCAISLSRTRTATGSASRRITRTSSSRPATSSIYRRADGLDDRGPLRPIRLHRLAELLGRLPARRVAELTEALAHRGRLERYLHRGIDAVDDARVEALGPEQAEPCD